MADTDTLPAPPKSFLNSPEFGADLDAALKADEASRAAADKPAAIAQPKPEPKPDAAKPDTKPEPTKPEPTTDNLIRTPKSEDFKKVKESKERAEKERDEWKVKYETVNSRIAELEKAAKTPAQQAKLEDSPEYQNLKALAEAREKEVNEYSEKLRLLDVEQHPKFQAYFKGKIDSQMEIAKEIGGDKLVSALQLPPGEFRDQRLDELIGELSPLKMSQLGSVLTNLRAIESERAREISSAKENYNQIQAQQKELTAKQQREVETIFKNISSEVTSAEKGLAVFQERPGDAEWNAGVQERLALAQHTFNGKLKPDDMARMAHWGAAAPVLAAELKTSLARIAELEKQIAESRELSPNPGGGGGGEDNAQPEVAKGLDGMMQLITAALPNR